MVRGTFCYAPNHTLNPKNSYGGNNNKNKKLKLTKFVSLHSKPIREDNKIFEGHVPSTIKCMPKVQQRNVENHTQKGLKWGGRVLPRELLNDRQGK